MKLPGTVPPNVQKVYFTPSEISFSTSRTSRLTMTLAGALRLVAGGTIGGLVRMACIGSPCGGPKSPAADPPVSSEFFCLLGAESLNPAMPSNRVAAIMTANGFVFIRISPWLSYTNRLRLSIITSIDLNQIRVHLLKITKPTDGLMGARHC